MFDRWREVYEREYSRQLRAPPRDRPRPGGGRRCGPGGVRQSA